ncbi:heavy_chain of myosin [Hexamita inflata]|uniref:Heavy_chain of myosin n=1 Tax=Hexamita inflata TaxID=28002 RepID=A0ABP1K194_9EUKA
MTIAGLSNAQMLMDTRIGVVDTRTAPMVQQIQNIQSLDVTQNNRLAALENTDINIQNRCKAIEDVNASQDVTISTLSGGVNGQITRVTALETLTNNWTPIMNCWSKPQDGWFQIQKDPTLHWDKITGFVQNTSLIINPKVDIYFGANNDYQPAPDRIILMSQKTIINPDRLLLHLFNTSLNKFEDKSIVDLLSSNDLTGITTRVVTLESNVGVLQSRCNQIDELNQNQTNNISSLQNFQASQIQTNLSNATSITTLTNSVSSLSTDNTTNKTNIKTLQTQMTDVINVNTTQSTSITNLQTQINNQILIENYYADNHSMTFCGIITFKWGTINVGSNLGQKSVTFANAFKMCAYAAFTTVIASSNGGSGADAGYAVADINGVTVTADYANNGGNESNNYAWFVIGW